MNEPASQDSPGSGRAAPVRVDAIHTHKHQRQALAASRAVLKVETIPVELATRFRPLAPELIEKITDRVHREVAAFTGPPQGRRRQLIHLAAEAGVIHFLDILENKPSRVGGVHDLFRRLGYAEAVAANDLDGMRAALQIATCEAWEALRAFAKTTGLPAEQLATLADAILAYTEQLILQVTIGYLSALQGVQRPVHEARRRLLTALLAGRPVDQLGQQAKDAGWTPPTQPAVLAASLAGPAHVPTLPRYGSDILVGLRRQRLTMMGGFEQIQQLAEALIEMPDIDRVAVSWPMSIDEIRHAYRWTCRALDLAALGLIEDEGVIYCDRYRHLLWLHADPRLSHHASGDLLAPLEDEKPHHRLMLAETMMLWLQTRESAPSLARRMDVHGQTVRHRLRKLRELFGEQLTDPQQTLALLSALELTIHRWRAGLRDPRRGDGD